MDILNININMLILIYAKNTYQFPLYTYTVTIAHSLRWYLQSLMSNQATTKPPVARAALFHRHFFFPDAFPMSRKKWRSQAFLLGPLGKQLASGTLFQCCFVGSRERSWYFSCDFRDLVVPFCERWVIKRVCEHSASTFLVEVRKSRSLSLFLCLDT